MKTLLKISCIALTVGLMSSCNLFSDSSAQTTPETVTPSIDTTKTIGDSTAKEVLPDSTPTAPAEK